MKGDFSRDTFQRDKHYHGVRLQQGRVQLDADWNELSDIVDYLRTTSLADLIGGAAAVPTGATAGLSASGFNTGGFAINATANGSAPAASGSNLLISSGRLYVDGILCESGRASAYLFTEQPDLPGTTLPNVNGTYVVYLDVWSRHVGAIEDPSIRELALGGPDTATRVRNVAQVKLVLQGDFAAATAPSTGQLAARVAQAAPTSNPCDVTGGAGFTGLENQLYRIEIHRGGGPGIATFKWSRDNGSVVAALSDIVSDGTELGGSPPAPLPNVLLLQSTPPDDSRFTVGQWIEIVDDALELQGRPGPFVNLTAVDGNRLTFDVDNIRNEAGAVAPRNSIDIDLSAHPKIRRWDGQDTTGVVSVPSAGGFLALENGVEVQFSSGSASFQSGDHWLVPARAGLGIEWPSTLAGSPPVLQPVPQAARGIVHHFARLATVTRNGTTFSAVQDSRRRLSPLTGMLADDVIYNVLNACQSQLALPPTTTVAAALEAICQRISAISTPNATQIPFANTAGCQTLLSLPSPTNVAAALDAICARVTGITLASLGGLPLSGGTLTGNLQVTGSVGATADITSSGGRIRDQKLRVPVTATTTTLLQSTSSAMSFTDIAPVLDLTLNVPGTANTPFLIRCRIEDVTINANATLIDVRTEFRLVRGTTVLGAAQRIFTNSTATPAAFDTLLVTFECVTLLAPGTHTIRAQWGAASRQASGSAFINLRAAAREILAIEL